MLAAGCILLLARLVPFEIGPAAGNRLTLEVYKTGLWKGRKHVFSFDRYHGSLEYDVEHPEQSNVRLVIEANSIHNHDDWVSDADRGKIVNFALNDMLEASRRPELDFESTRIVQAAANRFDVYGTLAIRGLARPVVVHVTAKPGDVFEGQARLRMTDWGMKPPKAALGLIGTADEMTLSFTLALSPQPPRSR